MPYGDDDTMRERCVNVCPDIDRWIDVSYQKTLAVRQECIQPHKLKIAQVCRL